MLQIAYSTVSPKGHVAVTTASGAVIKPSLFTVGSEIPVKVEFEGVLSAETRGKAMHDSLTIPFGGMETLGALTTVKGVQVAEPKSSDWFFQWPLARRRRVSPL